MVRNAYRVGLWARAKFSGPTFEAAHETRTGQRAALSVQSAAAAMQHLDQRSVSELSAQRVAKNVIDFAEQMEIFQVKAWLATFKARNAKS